MTLTLADLTHDHWTPVALSEEPGRWHWFMSYREHGALRRAVEQGGATTAQRKIGPERYELLARTVPVAPTRARVVDRVGVRG